MPNCPRRVRSSIFVAHLQFAAIAGCAILCTSRVLGHSADISSELAAAALSRASDNAPDCTSALVGNPTAKLASGTMSAQIDGVSWNAVCVTVNVGAPGLIGLGGSDNLASPTTFGFGFAGSNRVGTFPVDRKLGINALLTRGTAAWQGSAVTNGSGTLTFSASTASHAAGTFAFILPPTTVVPMKGNTATGTRRVTSGAFDIQF